MGIFDQVKQVMQMRNDAKRLQAEIDKISFEYANGGITVVAKGDFTISSIKISPEVWQEAVGGKPDKFETMLFSVVNGALKGVRKVMQEQMMAQMKNGGMGSMSNLFGK